MKTLIVLHGNDFFPVFILKVTFHVSLVSGNFVSPAAVRYCSGSSPRSCVGQKKAMLELYLSLSKKISMSRVFLVKVEY